MGDGGRRITSWKTGGMLVAAGGLSSGRLDGDPRMHNAS